MLRAINREQKRGFSTSFGVTIKERTFAAQHTRYQFNGKEYDSETETSDFGARNLDGDLGIWGALDPLMKKYPSFSPYIGMGNNPIIFKDSDGREIEVTTQSGQKQTLSILKKAFGKEGTNFSFNSDNKLVFSGNPDSFKGVEKEVFDVLLSVMKDDAVLSITYEKTTTTIMSSGESTTVRMREGVVSSAQSSIDPAENVDIVEIGEVPVYLDGNGFPTQNKKDAQKDKYGEPEPIGTTRGVKKVATNSKAARFFHAVGHVKYESEGEGNQYKVNVYDNKARSIFKKERNNGKFKSKPEGRRPVVDDTHKKEP